MVEASYVARKYTFAPVGSSTPLPHYLVVIYPVPYPEMTQELHILMNEATEKAAEDVLRQPVTVYATEDITEGQFWLLTRMTPPGIKPHLN